MGERHGRRRHHAAVHEVAVGPLVALADAPRHAHPRHPLQVQPVLLRYTDSKSGNLDA